MNKRTGNRLTRKPTNGWRACHSFHKNFTYLHAWQNARNHHYCHITMLILLFISSVRVPASLPYRFAHDDVPPDEFAHVRPTGRVAVSSGGQPLSSRGYFAQSRNARVVVFLRATIVLENARATRVARGMEGGRTVVRERSNTTDVMLILP